MIRIGPTTHSKPQKTPQSAHQRLNGLVCPDPRLLNEWLLSTINQVSWIAITELDLDLLALVPPTLISERDWHKNYWFHSKLGGLDSSVKFISHIPPGQ